MNGKKINLGMLGCSKILHLSIINALKGFDSIVPFGIASRNKEKAAEYASQYHIQNVFDNFESLLSCSDIDFVYISLPNFAHTEWIIKAVEAGKHVLVEKPICLNYDDCLKIKKALDKRTVHLLEAVMVQHHPWQSHIRDLITSQHYGKLKNIKTRISFTANMETMKNNYRSQPDKGGGVFWDLGTYWVQFLQSIADINEADFEGHSDFSGMNGCDWNFDAKLIWKNGLSTSFETSFEKPNEARHIIEFDKAIVTVEDFFRANTGNFKITLQIEDRESKNREKKIFPPMNYYANQLKFFYQVIQGEMNNIDFLYSMDRTRLMENIYLNAKSRIKS